MGPMPLSDSKPLAKGVTATSPAGVCADAVAAAPPAIAANAIRTAAMTRCPTNLSIDLPPAPSWHQELLPVASNAAHAGILRSLLQVVLAPTEQARQPGDAAADDKAGHGGADDDLFLVALDLLAPVRRLDDLRAQRPQGALELHAVGLDRGPDLLRCALWGHQWTTA